MSAIWTWTICWSFSRILGSLEKLESWLFPSITFARCIPNSDSEFFSDDLQDFLTPDYESKGTKRLRSSKDFPDSNSVLIKCGSGLSDVLAIL